MKIRALFFNGIISSALFVTFIFQLPSAEADIGKVPCQAEAVASINDPTNYTHGGWFAYQCWVDEGSYATPFKYIEADKVVIVPIVCGSPGGTESRSGGVGFLDIAICKVDPTGTLRMRDELIPKIGKDDQVNSCAEAAKKFVARILESDLVAVTVRNPHKSSDGAIVFKVNDGKSNRVFSVSTQMLKNGCSAFSFYEDN